MPQGDTFVLASWELRAKGLRVESEAAYRSGTMPEDHPFRWSMQALINREAILDFMFRQRKMVLIRKPGCGLGAIVAENCTDTCMDKVRAHFRIT